VLRGRTLATLSRFTSDRMKGNRVSHSLFTGRIRLDRIGDIRLEALPPET
jgi:hypothetical protein